MKTVPITTTRSRPACLPMRNDYSPICNNGIVGALPATPIAATPHVAAANITAQVRPSLHRGEQSPQKGEYHGKQGRHAGLPQRHAPNGYKTHHLEQPHFGCCNGRCRQRPYGWALGLVLCFLLVLGCSNPYERDNPTDPSIVYTITFNAPDATGGTPPAAIKGSYGDTVQIPADGGSLVRNGYTFACWEYKDSSGTHRAGWQGSPYIIKGNVTIYVDWVPASTVTFDGNGATSGTPPPPITKWVNCEHSSGISEVPGQGTLQRTGYVFVGWNSNPSGTGYNYQPGTSAKPSNTLYAKWLPARTVTFDGNGATSGTAPVAMTVADSSKIQLPAKGNLAKTGYAFVGWNTNSSGTGTSHSSLYTVTSDIILYANWVSCPECNQEKTYFYDTRDGKLYKITTIGTQTWMAENLNYNATGSKCYGNLDSNCDKYGRLYNWATALTVCPEGYHLPTQAEWNVLGDDAKKLKATTGWNSNGNGTDDYGFTALPGGYGNSNGSFNDVGSHGYWWSASESNSYNAYLRDMSYGNGNADWGYGGKSNLFSVRCLQGGSVSPSSSSSTPSSSSNRSSSSSLPSSSSLTQSSSSSNSSSSGISSSSSTLSSSSSVPSSSSLAQSSSSSSSSSSIIAQSGVVYGTPVTYEGQTYKTVVIGTQTWFAENLNYNATGSKCYDDFDSNCDIYGRLYDWETAKTVCPAGWHLPTQAEWNVLGNNAKKLKAVTGWNLNSNGTDDYGFKALPGGLCISDGSFYSVGYRSNWWSASSENYSSFAYKLEMSYESDEAKWDSNSKSWFYSVRCLKDN